MADLEKDDRIRKERNKLKRILKNIDPDKKKAIAQQIENAAWMAVSLEEIRSKIDEEGYIEYYKNGENQSGQKESSLVRMYNNMIKNYNATIKQLLDNLPEDEQNTDDKLADFLLEKK